MSVIYDKCPVCGGVTEAEGVNVGVGYIYPPFRCTECYWTEHCLYYELNECSTKCERYEWCHNVGENK